MLSNLGLLHTLISVFFAVLVLCLIVRMVLSWLPFPPGNPITLFFLRITDPIIEPVRRRLPTMSVGPVDISSTVAFIFTWWALGILGALLVSALPYNW